MTAVVCTELYPIEVERNPDNQTFAVRNLVEAARAHGADISAVIRFRPLLTPTSLTRPRVTTVRQVRVIDVPRMGTLHHYSASLTRALLNSLHLLDEPRVVVCHLAKSFLTAKRVLAFPNAKFLYVVHSSDLCDTSLQKCLAQADAVYCRSLAIQRQLSSRGIATDGVLSSGIPSAEIAEYEARPMERELRIVIASRLIPLRNIEQTLEAVALLRGEAKVRVDVFGDGPQFGPLHRMVANRLPNVTLHGFKPRQDVLRAMQRAHLFVMPSAPETFGLAYLEAMSKGCVVVGHEGWGIDGIVADGRNGYLVRVPTPEAIAGKIREYLASDRDALHRASHATASAHTAEEAGRHYADAIARLAAS